MEYRSLMAVTVLTIASVFALAKCVGEDIAERAQRRASAACTKMVAAGYEDEVLPPGCSRDSLPAETDIYPDDNP